jgi:hypothetical protein
MFQLTKRVCSVYHIKPEVMKTPSNSRGPAAVRGVICYIAMLDLGYKGKETAFGTNRSEHSDKTWRNRDYE